MMGIMSKVSNMWFFVNGELMVLQPCRTTVQSCWCAGSTAVGSLGDTHASVSFLLHPFITAVFLGSTWKHLPKAKVVVLLNSSMFWASCADKIANSVEVFCSCFLNTHHFSSSIVEDVHFYKHVVQLGGPTTTYSHHCWVRLCGFTICKDPFSLNQNFEPPKTITNKNTTNINQLNVFRKGCGSTLAKINIHIHKKNVYIL